MLRLDATSGELLEEHRWGGSGDEEAHDFVLAGDVGYLSGQTDSWGAGNWAASTCAAGSSPGEAACP